MVKITGNTYPVRDRLKALGGRPKKEGGVWVWYVPDDKADEARAMVPAAKRCGTRRPKTCQRCGCRINYGVYCGKCEFS